MMILHKEMYFGAQFHGSYVKQQKSKVKSKA